MKYIKFILLVLIIFVMIIPIHVAASEKTGIQTSEIDEVELEQYVNSFSVSFLEEEPKKLAIKCFDVSETGLIGIGGQESEECYVYIYNSDFEFMYAFHFECMGLYYIEWNNEFINIYYIRSGIAATYNSNAEIISIRKIDNTMENNSYWYILRSTKKQINDIEYRIKNDMGIFNLFVGQSSYSQLVKIDGFENQTILYDVNSKLFAKTLMIFIFVLLFVTTDVIVVTKLTIKSIRQYKQEQQRIIIETQRNNSSTSPKAD